MKIKVKINLILITGTLIIILSLGGIIGFMSSTQLKTINQQYITKINNTKAHEIEMFLKGEQEVLLSLSASTVFRDLLKSQGDASQYEEEIIRTTQRLDRSIKFVEQIEELFILNKNGKVIATTNQLNLGADKSNDQYFIGGKQGVYIKSFYFSEATKTNAYAVSAPIIDDASKELLGVIVARMIPDNLYRAVGIELADTKTGENFLLDSNYFLITPTRYLDKNNVLNKKIETQNAINCFSPEEMDEARSNPYSDQIHSGHGSLLQYIDYRGIEIIGTHHYIPEAGWCLITKEDLSEVLAPSYSLLYIFIIVSIIILIVFILISFYISSKMTRSILLIKDGIKLIEAGDLNQKVSINTKDEIGELSESFDKMVEAVKKSRSDVDKKVEEQTKEILEKRQGLEDQQKATLNILEDVEEEKEKITAAEARNSALLEGIGDGVIAMDNNDKIIFINKNGARMLGYDERSVIGKNAYDVLKIKDEKGKLLVKEDRPLYQAIKTGKTIFSTIQNGYTYERKDKINFAVAIVASPVIINGLNVGVIDVFRDITNETQIDKAKNEFVSLASHQLRTPLSAINWYAEMILAGDAGKVNKDQKEYIEEIYKSNQRMIELVNALLNVSRIDLGTFAIEPKLLDIKEIADGVIKQIDQKIKEKGIKFTKKYDPNISKINIDPNLTEIIFQNLLTNAVKYTQNKGSVSLSIEKKNNDTLITVKDNGYGIPKAVHDKIFGKLYRADNIRVKETDGNGLGLYILKSIVEQSGGKIWFESEENKGTTFYVTILLSGMNKKGGTKGLDKTA
jgi:PAS domain S-box-containing protein